MCKVERAAFNVSILSLLFCFRILAQDCKQSHYLLSKEPLLSKRLNSVEYLHRRELLLS